MVASEPDPLAAGVVISSPQARPENYGCPNVCHERTKTTFFMFVKLFMVALLMSEICIPYIIYTEIPKSMMTDVDIMLFRSVK